MKFLKKLAGKVTMLAVAIMGFGGSLALPSKVDAAEAAFSGGRLVATNRAVVIISASGHDGGETPSVRWLTATSDLASATVSFYRSGVPVKITGASSGATNRVFVGSSGATFATSNQVLVLRHRATDTYERLVSFTNTTQTVTFTHATASAVANGDELTIHTLDASYPSGAATVTVQHPEGIYHGIPNRPLLFEVNGTTLAKIPLYSGRFWKP